MTKAPDSVTNGFRRLPCFMFLWDMKHAERTFIFLVLSLSMSACGLNQIDESLHSNTDGVWEGPSFGYYTEDKCYAVALDYPEGYDWRTDPDRGSVKCHMVMFADGVPVLRIPVGDAFDVSSDPDSHFVAEGHLYTSFPDGESTVVKKDGRRLYEFSGAEYIDDIKLSGDSVHILSTPSGSGGFVYRIDGDPVVERNDGYSFRHIDIHEGQAFFYFCQDVIDADGRHASYYRSTDGKIQKLDIIAGGKVADIRMFDSDVVLSLEEGRNIAPALASAGHIDTLRTSLSSDAIAVSFIDHEKPCMSVRFLHSGSNLMTDVIWTGGQEWKMYRLGCTFAAASMDAAGYCAVINPHDGRSGNVFSGNRAYDMPAGYSVFTGRCIVRKNGVLHVGLTPSGMGCPVVWKEDGADTLKVNGPVISLQ